MATAESCDSFAVTARRTRVAGQSYLRWFLVLVLAWSAGAKVFKPGDFQRSMAATGMFPDSALPPIAYALPTVEFGLALLLASGLLRPVSLLGVSFLSAVFVGLHGYLLWSGSVVPCGCAGISITHSARGSHAVMLVLSSAMLIAAGYLLLSSTATLTPRNVLIDPLLNHVGRAGG